MLDEVIEKMEEIGDKSDFDGWDAWIELREWLEEKRNAAQQSAQRTAPQPAQIEDFVHDLKKYLESDDE